jgi:hypothetical protein
MKPPTIVFCTTCKGRAQHIEQTLPRNLADNFHYPHAKFLILDYNSQDQLISYLRRTYHSPIDSGRLVVYSFPEGKSFKMAHAKNMAHRCGILEGADILVNLDADNFTGPGFATYIADQFQKGSDIFLWARMVKGLMPRGIHGRIVVSRHAFLNVGGYDEKYESWGPDDKDFNTRLQRLGYAAREIDPIYLINGVPHNDKIRFREYPEARMATGEEQFEVSESNTVSNFGKFGCGVVYKNFDLFNQVFDPITLGALPTRIFGIGMHKTATTSLHTALNTLGFDSAHWKNAHWAKAIWQEMVSSGRSPTLERNYALCDLPITLLYKELDRAYPGSKFILTTRNQERWLEAVRNHWDPNYNKYRKAWDTDPFTHKVHTLLYGRRAFDEGIFLARFRQHNAEVLEYFRDRPGELLVLNVDSGDGWNELCGFLKVPVPRVPYPNIDPVAKGK